MRTDEQKRRYDALDDRIGLGSSISAEPARPRLGGQVGGSLRELHPLLLRRSMLVVAESTTENKVDDTRRVIAFQRDSVVVISFGCPALTVRSYEIAGFSK